MKIRTGFVSNSSASSFCIYGVRIEKDELFSFKGLSKLKEKNPEKYQQLLKRLKKDGLVEDEKMELFDNMTKEKEDEINETLDEVSYELGEIVGEVFDGLEFITTGEYDEDALYVGKSWKNIGADETGGQFRENVEKALKEVLNGKIKCDTIQEAWYNG